MNTLTDYDVLHQRLTAQMRVADAIAEVKRSVEWGFEKGFSTFEAATYRDDQLRYAVERAEQITRLPEVTPADVREMQGLAKMALESRFAVTAELLAHAKHGDAKFAPDRMEAKPKELEDVKAAMGAALDMDPSRVFVDVITTLERIKARHAAGDTAVLGYLDELNWLGTRSLVEAAQQVGRSDFVRASDAAVRPIVAKAAGDGEVKCSPLARHELNKMSF